MPARTRSPAPTRRPAAFPDRPGRTRARTRRRSRPRPAGQRHAAEDPRQPPHVLVLEVARGRPLVHADGEHVAARREQRPHVELGRQPAARPEAQFRAVEPGPRARLDAVEAQHHLGAHPVGRHVERHPVVARGVLLRRVRRVDGERVDHVGVPGFPVSVQRPVRGDGQRVPRRVVEVGGREVGGHVGHRRQPEPPVPREIQRRRVGSQRRAWRPESRVRHVVVVVGHRNPGSMSYRYCGVKPMSEAAADVSMGTWRPGSGDRRGTSGR